MRKTKEQLLLDILCATNAVVSAQEIVIRQLVQKWVVEYERITLAEKRREAAKLAWAQRIQEEQLGATQTT